MKYDIIGSNMQLVIIEFEPGETIFSESGAMVYMSENVEMHAKAMGGFLAGLKRKFLTKESFFMQQFSCTGGTGIVAFGGNAPGKIVPIDLRGGHEYVGQKGAYLGSEASVTLDTALQKKIGAMMLGGQGAFLQKYRGEGTVFLTACGDMVEMHLQPGQTIKVDTNCAVVWESSVSYDIQRAGNVKTMLLGGEGMFINRLTGPGLVILQSMTMSDLARSLLPFIFPKKRGQ